MFITSNVCQTQHTTLVKIKTDFVTLTFFLFVYTKDKCFLTKNKGAPPKENRIYIIKLVILTPQTTLDFQNSFVRIIEL